MNERWDRNTVTDRPMTATESLLHGIMCNYDISSEAIEGVIDEVVSQYRLIRKDSE